MISSPLRSCPAPAPRASLPAARRPSAPSSPSRMLASRPSLRAPAPPRSSSSRRPPTPLLVASTLPPPPRRTTAAVPTRPSLPRPSPPRLLALAASPSLSPLPPSTARRSPRPVPPARVPPPSAWPVPSPSQSSLYKPWHISLLRLGLSRGQPVGDLFAHHESFLSYDPYEHSIFGGGEKTFPCLYTWLPISVCILYYTYTTTT